MLLAHNMVEGAQLKVTVGLTEITKSFFGLPFSSQSPLYFFSISGLFHTCPFKEWLPEDVLLKVQFGICRNFMQLNSVHNQETITILHKGHEGLHRTFLQKFHFGMKIIGAEIIHLKVQFCLDIIVSFARHLMEGWQ